MTPSHSEHSPLRDEGPQQGVPLAPGLDVSLVAAHMPRRTNLLELRVLWMSALAMLLGACAAVIARVLVDLIALVTNIAFFGRWSLQTVSPAGHTLGAWVVVVPVIGGLLVGLMARWGSRAIRGHGIPEAMEQVLLNASKIPPRITFLKPLSSALAIGTGGPFGAEGPIIATGGALGSFIGQVLRVTGHERKVLLAAGAAAGMTAIFGSPVAAVVLAVELLLFELRARSLIPVALAAVTAAGIRYASVGSAPVFAMPAVAEPQLIALTSYVLLGALMGLVSVGVTRLLYAIEDAFEQLPIHWMWWPAMGGVVVGVVGWFAPLTLGVGYSNIEDIIAGHLAVSALVFLCVMKFISWSVALGSGTSGGTLAPLFTIGGALGALAGVGLATLAPQWGVDPRIAGLVGMAAIFAGASRALLTSVVFAFETTQQPHGLLPLLGGCTAAYLISALLMRNTIMTEKIARRGVRVPSEYAADFLEQVAVGDACSREVVTLRTADALGDVRAWIQSGRAEYQHQGFPVLDDAGRVRGVVTRRDLLSPIHPNMRRIGEMLTRTPVVVHAQHSLREAADHMVAENIGRVVVVDDQPPHGLIGILTRGDLLAAHSRRLKEAHAAERHIRIRERLRIRRRV